MTLIVSGTGLLVGKHSVATFHVEDFIVDTTVISVLVSEVIKLLTEFGNKLVFLGAADSNTMIR